MVECNVCKTHTFSLGELFDEHQTSNVCCPVLSKSITIDEVAPDLYLPQVKKYPRKYFLKETIGEGAFGIVFRSLNEDGEEIAIKKFKSPKSAGYEINSLALLNKLLFHILLKPFFFLLFCLIFL